jgi:hypothetical protein
MAAISRKFGQGNPGYQLEWLPDCGGLLPTATARVLFVQRGSGEAAVRAGSLEQRSQVTPGDVVVVRPGQALVLSVPLGCLSFSLPESPPATVPTFVRPDWDPKITDTPGGCATESGAYRRILLTWRPENGPYVLHSLNAHRVRITDSFSHYHPRMGGFDEFYLVQMVQPGGRLITSDSVSAIEHPEQVTAEQAATLLRYTQLQVGDLVYLPRGLMHRGIGGVLAQVITVPGFVPGAEIGVDHHLRAIDDRLGLRGIDALPYNQEASTGPVVR